jgi:RNA polymerase sigma-70 factor (ECF subfamily)
MDSGLAPELDEQRISHVAACPASQRAAALVQAQFDFVWRSLRRMGLEEADADDATQEVFLVASRRFDDIEPGRERAFVFATALRVASTHRRRTARRAEVLDGHADRYQDEAPDPEQMAHQVSARRLLDQVLDELSLEQRAVFVLFELEQLSAPAIAELLEVPLGTVASRLRRGRRAFCEAVKRLRAREGFRWRSS